MATVLYSNQYLRSDSFGVKPAAVQNIRDMLFLDMDSLSQWGEFSLPETVWLAFSRFVCWVEPVLVSEWMKTMQGYQGNQSPEQQAKILHSLDWLEANLALPGLSTSNTSIDDLFEALDLQRSRLKEMQQLAEWRGNSKI